jgi:uncharacterized protein YciI
MLTLLIYDVVPNYVERRAPYRAEHLRHAEAAVARGELLLAGATADPVDGAVLVFRADRATVERFAQGDPYVKNGLVTSFRVRGWTAVVGTLLDVATQAKA